MFFKTVTIKDSEGNIVGKVDKHDREFVVETATSKTIDLRPLSKVSNLEIIHLKGNAQVGINSPHAILPSRLLNLKVLVVRGKVENPEVLTNFKNLETLNPGIFYFPDSLNFIRNFPNLKSLEINANKFDNIDVLREFTNLEELTLNKGWKFDLEPIRELKRLKVLQLEGHLKGLEVIQDLTSLEKLRLFYFKIKNTKILKNLTALKELSLFSSNVVAIDEIALMKDLESLDLRQTKVTNNSLNTLRSLRKLKNLNLMYCDITNITPIDTLNDLEELNLYDLKNPLVSLKPLEKLKKLKSLNVSVTQTKDKDITPVLNLKSLTELYITIYSETDEDILKQNLLNCRIRTFKAPHKDEYITVGFVKVWKPNKKQSIDYYSIDQDLTDEIGYEEQSKVESEIIKKLTLLKKEFLKHVDFDSEGSAFVANSKDKDAILYLARMINKLAKK